MAVSMIDSILLVCHANVCRSPMAEALLRQALGAQDIRVGSAGIHAAVGTPADPMIVQMLRERNLDLSAHRARRFDGALASAYALVLTMELAQVEWICAHHPQLRGRVFRLAHWSGEDIADPHGAPPQAYQHALHQIVNAIEAWMTKLS